jgi:hypothetical protein
MSNYVYRFFLKIQRVIVGASGVVMILGRLGVGHGVSDSDGGYFLAAAILIISFFDLLFLGKLAKGSVAISRLVTTIFFSTASTSVLVWGLYEFLIDDGGKPIFLLTFLGVGVINGIYLIVRHAHMLKNEMREVE